MSQLSSLARGKMVKQKKQERQQLHIYIHTGAEVEKIPSHREEFQENWRRRGMIAKSRPRGFFFFWIHQSFYEQRTEFLLLIAYSSNC